MVCFIPHVFRRALFVVLQCVIFKFAKSRFDGMIQLKLCVGLGSLSFYRIFDLFFKRAEGMVSLMS